MGAIQLTCACHACGGVVAGPLTAEITCPHCSRPTPLPEHEQTLAASPLAPCPVCGSEDLYHQRDFNRKTGILLAAIGLLLGPFTYWISTVVAIGIDALLYLTVPSVCVCYACNAQYRSVPKERRPAAFDIAIHDTYKFDRRHPPRPEMAVAGPLAKRRRRQGNDG